MHRFCLRMGSQLVHCRAAAARVYIVQPLLVFQTMAKNHSKHASLNAWLHTPAPLLTLLEYLGSSSRLPKFILGS